MIRSAHLQTIGTRSLADSRLATLSRARLRRKVKIAFVGASVTEGYELDATSGPPLRTGCFASLICVDLRSQMGLSPTGSLSVPCHYSDPISNWTLTGDTVTLDSFGLGIRGVYTPSGTGGFTYTFTGTGLDLMWLGNPGFGSFTWQIDGGPATLVSGAVVGPEPGGTNLMQFTQIRGLSFGNHTLTCIGNGTGLACWSGAYVYRGDENVGVHYYDAGHAGQSLLQMYGGFVGAGTDSLTNQLNNLAPDAIVCVDSCVNDWAGSVPTSTIATEFQELIRQFTNVTSNPSLIIGRMYEIVVPPPVDTWMNVRAAMLTVMNANPNVFQIDLNIPIPGGFVGGLNASLDNGGHAHPNSAGSRRIADYFSSILKIN